MRATFDLDGLHTLEVQGDVPRLKGDAGSVQIKINRRPVPFQTGGDCGPGVYAEYNITPPVLPPGQSPTSADEIIYYGPHACGVCGEMIVKASMNQGGAEYNAPSGPIYPNTRWTPHVHRTSLMRADPIENLYCGTVTPSAARAIASVFLSAATEAKG